VVVVVLVLVVAVVVVVVYIGPIFTGFSFKCLPSPVFASKLL
jgi:hypothetical protein